MKNRVSVGLMVLLGGMPLLGQTQPEVQQLKQQLEQVKEAFEKAQAEHRRQMELLSRKIADLEQKQAATAEQEKIKRDLELALAEPGKTNSLAPAASAATQARPWSPSDPISLRSGSAYMNVSFDVLMDAGGSTAGDPGAALQLGGHDPLQRGFSLPNAEMAFEGAVDPYFKGLAIAAMHLDKDNETHLELEEAYVQSSALPANLQVKAGQYYAAFGRQNLQHPHQWGFVDQPIILNRALGPDGLRNAGAQVSWLAPTPFYSELMLGVLNGSGGTAFSFRNPGEPDNAGVNRYLGRATFERHLRGAGDLVYVPRLASSFDLSDTQTLLAGLSGAFGPNNTGLDARSEVYGVDLYWKWKAANATAGFPFVSFQTEALYRRLDAAADGTAVPALPAEVVRDAGFYSEVLWGFRPRWVAGLRGEWAGGNSTLADAADLYRGDRRRVSPGLTWYPTEFSKIRLQYNYDHGEHFGDEHSVWLQFEFMLGAHAAHKF